MHPWLPQSYASGSLATHPPTTSSCVFAHAHGLTHVRTSAHGACARARASARVRVREPTMRARAYVRSHGKCVCTLRQGDGYRTRLRAHAATTASSSAAVRSRTCAVRCDSMRGDAGCADAAPACDAKRTTTTTQRNAAACSTQSAAHACTGALTDAKMHARARAHARAHAHACYDRKGMRRQAVWARHCGAAWGGRTEARVLEYSQWCRAGRADGV